MKKSTILYLFPLLLSCQPQDSNNETDYKYGTQIGQTPCGVFENSGMGYSSAYDRLYFVNDGNPLDLGDAKFFVTNLQGELIEKVKVSDSRNRDIEAFSMGPCGDGDQCLFLADIGDNNANKGSYTIYVIKEREHYDERAELFSKVSFTHPQGISHNHEAIAVHPLSGDIFITTKNYDGDPSLIYKIRASQWQGKQSSEVVTKQVGSVDYIALDSSTKEEHTWTGAMSISPSGERFLLITVQSEKVWEFDFDLSANESFTSSDLLPFMHQISVDYLGQEESIEYLSEDSFVYSTEGGSAPVLRVDVR